MKTLVAEPLTAVAFAPHGDVWQVPAEPGRAYFDQGLVNLRPIAGKPSLSFAHIARTAARPLPLAKVERHQFSSQAFVPLAPFRYLVGVLPMAAGADAPDFDKLRVFVASPGQAINYHANVWHLPMQTLEDGTFAVVMFNDGTAADTELRDMPAPAVVSV